MGNKKQKDSEIETEIATQEEDATLRLKQLGSALKEAHKNLSKMLSDLQDINDSFPVIQEFLRSRRLTSVRELDEQGNKELSRHLELAIQRLIAKSKIDRIPKGSVN